MIHIIHKLPRQLTVACSGGVDSMAVLNFLMRNHEVTAAFFHHGTRTSDQAESFVKSYCTQHQVQFISQHIDQATTPKDVSKEEHWRTERYKFLHSIGGTVITAHHLDDCVETYLFNCMHGKSHTIPYANKNVIRPFLLTAKSEFTSWCVRHQVPWQDDASNLDTHHMRNYIRHELMPHVKKINPGIATVVKNIVKTQLKE